jgi:hypothetical protein
MVRDRHDNRALIVSEDEPLSLREFYVPLRGPEFDLSLFQPLKFWAGHLNLLRKVMRQSEIRAEHSVLPDHALPLVTLSLGQYFDRIANSGQQFSDRRHAAV